jgi:membrane protease YdiL (CAAX protease family)
VSRATPCAGRPWREIGLFALLTLAASAPFYTLILWTGRTGGAHGAYATGLMWAPGLAALAACRLLRVPLATLGWGIGAPRWLLLAVLIPLAYSLLAYAAVWIFGFGRVPDPEYVEWARRDLGWSAAPDWIVLAGSILLAATTGLVQGLARALGEEMGWRGFLSPRAAAAFGPGRGTALTAICWFLWHLPLILAADYNDGADRGYALLCFGVLVAAMSVMLGWLRARSGSLWPCALLHAAHNLLIQTILTPVTGSVGPATDRAIGEFGAAVPAAMLVLVCVAWGAGALRRGPGESRALF